MTATERVTEKPLPEPANAVQAVTAAPAPTEAVPVPVTFSQSVLDRGFNAGLLLSGACLLLCGAFLIANLVATIMASNRMAESRGLDVVQINATLMIQHMAFRSCGISVGMAFGFLGFCLFLIGVRDQIKTDLSHERIRASIAQMSSGVFVLACSMILIGYCISHAYRSDISYTPSGAATAAGPVRLGSPPLGQDSSTEVAPTKEDEALPSP